MNFYNPDEIIHTQNALDGVYSLIEDLEKLKRILDHVKKSGENIQVFEQEVQRLSIEVNLLFDNLYPRYNDIVRLQYDILFKFQKDEVSQYHRLLYKGMTYNRRLQQVPRSDRSISIETKTLLRDNFRINISEKAADKLFEFLKTKEYISGKSSKKAIRSMLVLEPINLHNRIIWVDKTRTGQYAIKPLLRILTQCFDRLTGKKHNVKNYDYLIDCYFQTPDGSISTVSIAPILNRIATGETNTSDRETELIGFLLKLNTNYPNNG